MGKRKIERQLNYNPKLLFEDIKFPLNWGDEDYKQYIFDSYNHMVAQAYYPEGVDPKYAKHPFEKLIGSYKEISSQEEKFQLIEGDYFDFNGGFSIGLVRGWGRLQKKKSPKGEKRQDNIANYILNVING